MLCFAWRAWHGGAWQLHQSTASPFPPQGAHALQGPARGPPQVLQYVGAGAHGKVFKALWRDQLVAIKVRPAAGCGGGVSGGRTSSWQSTWVLSCSRLGRPWRQARVLLTRLSGPHLQCHVLVVRWPCVADSGRRGGPAIHRPYPTTHPSQVIQHEVDALTSCTGWWQHGHHAHRMATSPHRRIAASPHRRIPSMAVVPRVRSVGAPNGLRPPRTCRGHLRHDSSEWGTASLAHSLVGP